LPVASCQLAAWQGNLFVAQKQKRFRFSCKMTETSVNGFGLSQKAMAPQSAKGWEKDDGRRIKNAGRTAGQCAVQAD